MEASPGERRRGRMPFAGTGGAPGLGGRLTFLFGLLLGVTAHVASPSGY